MDISHVTNPSSSMSTLPDHQVFLSFRGPDAHRNFADFLYTSLTDVGIRVFKDDKELEVVGKEINPQLIEAVEQSKVSIPVISKEYTSSTSCLMELDQMVKRMDNKNRTIIPIFYYVDPSDVRNCTGPFEEALNEHQKRGRDDSILNLWKSALQRIGELMGYHLQEKNERPLGEVIKEIVREVEQELKMRDLIVPKQLVGVDPHAQEIMEKLKVDYYDGQAKIGDTCGKVLIHGIPGVGKTVLAKYVCDQLNHLFDACSFLEKIQEEIRDHGIVSVQNRLISHLLKGNAPKFDSSDTALGYIQGRFLYMKVLLLLDDVKDHKQLTALVGELDWLGPGSRVILTSQRQDVLRNINGVESFFLEPMKEDEALKLFCWHAFGTDSPPQEFEELSTNIVAATDGLPLALEKVGEFLSRKSKNVWTEKLIQLKEAPDESVREAFLQSYTTLAENEKNIFLDIACFFNGMDKRIPYYMWRDLLFYPKTSILSLHARSWVKIGQDKKLLMHEILKKFGWEIVNNENRYEPSERSRLWKHEEALSVLTRRKGTEKVEALVLEFGDGFKGNISFERDQFDGLKNLRFLKLDRAAISKDFGNHLLRLRWLVWQGSPRIFPIQSVNLNLENLVILDLSESQVDTDWRGWKVLEGVRKLKVLKLTGCVQLTAPPKFPASMELERLILEGCSNLAVIGSSFHNLEKLVSLNMKGCSLLCELPDLGPMRSLKELLIDGTSISQINFQEGSMMMLKTLSARDCKDLTDISDSIGYLKSLKYLALDGSGIHTLPESIGSLERLKTLSLKNCQRLTDLPNGINRLSLETLWISRAMCSYDVFLIFKGPDMLRNFADIMYTMLTDAGICVYREENLERGKEIHPELKAAIVQSKISIPVISEEFASSKSCLMELEQMLECMDNNQHTPIPIFYYVDPWNEHNYNGSFERSFVEHKERGVSDSVIDSWKSALHRIRKLKGYHLHKSSNMDGRLNDLVSYVTRLLKEAELVAPSMLVGIDDQVCEMMRSLDVDYRNRQAVKIHDNRIRMVGIHGIQGVGKTTLAKRVYSQLYPLFEGCSYLGNIQEISKTKSLEHLQSQLVSDLLKQEPISLGTLEEGIYYIKHRFRNMRVLVVLDDVNELHHLKAFAGAIVGSLSWFGSRSRIIVTTRNADLLKLPVVHSRCEVKPMKFDQSLLLFHQHAFRGSSPHKDYGSVSRQIVSTIGGFPLAIAVAGSNLYKLNTKMWNDMLQLLKKGPANPVHPVLRTTYDALDQGPKDIFLDIACFFIGKDKRIPFYMWEDCGFDPRSGIMSLVRMSLVKIRENNKLLMYDSFRDLGREIVHMEEPTNPGRRSRLWNHEDALDTLLRKRGMEMVEALCLKFADGSHNCFISKEFQRLSGLRFLKLDNVNLQGDFMSILSNLRWLDWQGCPDTFEASNLHLENLVILELPSSKVTHKWDGWHQIKMPRLKVLNLIGCNEMQITPDFSHYPQLEMLILEGCSQLVKIDPSICSLGSLVSLNLKSCSNLSVLPPEMGSMEKLEELLIDGTSMQEIPKSIAHMTKLKTLSASNCYSLSYLPETICSTEALSMLLLDNVKILKLPNSIGSLVKLQRLSLRDCWGIRELPESIGELGFSLVELDVSGTLILKLPDSVRNLQLLRVLKMERCHVGEFPSAIGELRELEEIHASHCRNLKGSIPDGIRNLQFLKILMLGYSCVSSLPESIQLLSRLQTLDLLYCDYLETLPMLPSSLTCLRISSKKMSKILNIESLVELEDLSFGDGSPKELMVPPPDIDPTSISTELQSCWSITCPKLKSLELSHSRIQNLGFEYDSACIPLLKKVILIGAKLERVSELPSSLSVLSIQASLSLKSLPTVQNLIYLLELELLNLAVEEIKGLGELQSLEVLVVSNCPIVHLNSLSKLTSLKRLSLKNCNTLDKLPNVSNLTMLKVLEIHQCRGICDIEGLEELSSLEELHVSECEAERSARVKDAQERIKANLAVWTDDYLSSLEELDLIEAEAERSSRIIDETKRKRSSRGLVPNKNEQPVPKREEEEKHYAGISTKLVLYEDPWKIRKKLTVSDVHEPLSRLLIPQGHMETYVLSGMSGEVLGRLQSKGGMQQPVPKREEEEKHYAGISTKLVLYEDPWKIRKKLTVSDVHEPLSRLLIPQGHMETYELSEMSGEVLGRLQSKGGMQVGVRDADTGDEHRLVFGYWASSKCYVLSGGWTELFVKRRELKVGDEIGMLWDPYSLKFHFTVLREVAGGTSHATA